MKKVSTFILSIIALMLLFSCATMKNPYPNMATIRYEDTIAYEFKNNTADTLIICFEGSGYNSVLGFKEDDTWRWLGFSYVVVQALKDTYTIIIPEKFNRQAGMNYVTDPDMIAIYSLENLVEHYVLTINNYVLHNPYASIVLIGHSEGAAVLPLVYEKITEKAKVKSMVALSYGGLSLYEQRKILADSTLDMPNDWRVFFQNTDRYKQEVALYPKSLGTLGDSLSYIWYHSFFDYRPFDYYVNITIPVLFIHGKKDINVPVESTQYIQEHLPNKPFDYLYLENADHGFQNRQAIKKLKAEGIKWLNEHS